MKRKFNGGDPTMTSGTPLMPIYDYRTHIGAFRRMPEPPVPAVPSVLDHGGRGSDLCAIGFCPRCGRTIISAVHKSKDTLSMLCGLCGRE